MWTLSVATTTMKELFDGCIVVFAVSSWLIALPMQGTHAIDALTAVRPLCSVYRFPHRAHEFVGKSSVRAQVQRSWALFSTPPSPPPRLTSMGGRMMDSGRRRWISERTIQRVTEEAVLSEICEEHVQVRRLGSSVVAVCPFHDDTRPSMNIDDEKNLYYCFSCGAGGNIFTFVQGMEGMTFVESVEMLASTFSVPVEYEDRGGNSGGVDGFRSNNSAQNAGTIRGVREEQRRVMGAAADWYGRQLASHPEAGAARAHLSARGVGPNAAVKWGLGWAPEQFPSIQQPPQRPNISTGPSCSSFGVDGSGPLREYLVECLGFPVELLVEVGLLAPSRLQDNNKAQGWSNEYGTRGSRLETSALRPLGDQLSSAPHHHHHHHHHRQERRQLKPQPYFERFRGRLMLPIRDAQGHVVAFGARTITSAVEDPLVGYNEVVGSAGEKEEEGEQRGGANGQATVEGNKDEHESIGARATLPYNPKYLNSPETAAFRKRETLFGLDTAKRGIRAADCAVLVEGYFDVLALHELHEYCEIIAGTARHVGSSGLGNVCGVLGTALTEQQVRKAARFSRGRRVVLCMDGDVAGLRATERACEEILPALLGGDVSAASPSFLDALPTGKGKNGATESIENSSSILGGSSGARAVEVRIATMPPGFKDPSDLFDAGRSRDPKIMRRLRALLEEEEEEEEEEQASVGGLRKRASKKRRNPKHKKVTGHDWRAASVAEDEGPLLAARVMCEVVIGRAEAWTEWYAKRIIFGGDKGIDGTRDTKPSLVDASDFSRKVGRLTDLVAALPSAADRTFHAFRFAEMLAGGNLPYQQQLEQDIAAVAADKRRCQVEANARAALRATSRQHHHN